jgi:E3 ubiquitin-protein ligase CCNP1IP1
MRAEIEDLQHTTENLGSALREKGRKLTQTEELYQKIKRKAMLEEIEHTASQVVGSNIEAATSAGATLVDQHLGHQRMYPRGTVVSPRYANAQLSPRYTLDAQMSPPMDLAAHGALNHSYGNPYRGIQPLRNAADGGGQPRGKLFSVAKQS